MQKTNRKLVIIDSETGEIIADSASGDLIRYTKSSSIESYKRFVNAELEKKLKERETYQPWVLDGFYKGNTTELKNVMKELSVYEKAFLFSIAPYIGYEDCCIKYPNGNELTFDKMVEISGISRSKLLEVIQSLIKKDIIYKEKNSNNIQYFVNPWLFCKGNRINKVLKTMFKNYKIKICENKKWKDLRE